MARPLTHRNGIEARSDRQAGHRARRGAAIGLAVASWLLAAGCQTSGPAAATPETPTFLVAGTWQVDQIDGQPVQDPATAPTVTFDGAERLSGSTGCNLYTAPLTVAGPALRVGDAAMTLRACPPAVMEQEGRFLAALAAVRGYRLDGDTLELADESGRVRLRLSRS